MPQLPPVSIWPLDWSLGTFSALGVGYLLLVRLLRWKRYNIVHQLGPAFYRRIGKRRRVHEDARYSVHVEAAGEDRTMMTTCMPYTHSYLSHPYVHCPTDGEKLTREFLKQWAKRYGWRSMSPLECQARFVLWNEIGTLMGIKDIPETIEELETWMEAFEEIHMIPAESSRQCAEATLAESTYNVTSLFGLKTLVRNILICLLDERTRTALMLPEPPRAVRIFLEVVLRTAAFVQGHLLLPRRSSISLVPWEMKVVASEPVPRQNPNWYAAKPWYKPEPKGVSAIIQNAKVALGLLDPDDIPGPKYRAEGYRMEELGPPRYENSGHAEVIREAGKMMGCPLGLDGGRIQTK
ncbi:hypothetical protein EWM64_g1506 [Hericium alpestre]|uniref:ER-bound oxygenase mpaB/mpaB'/Rubber oxygenase catalytic domain-containing protein n=1 Tax=Hericium alpestre TaxID=135208 RepID=A0A4Z0A872_9AGAM|nr:hypothetical protein EWM64_g1506 [Hericium alpestre]